MIIVSRVNKVSVVVVSNLVAVIDTNRQNALSNLIQKLVKEKKEPDLDLKIYNEEMTLDKITPFQKKM